jgi:hypothetical protein
LGWRWEFDFGKTKQQKTTVKEKQNKKTRVAYCTAYRVWDLVLSWRWRYAVLLSR